jgi:hypothetical protein
MLDNLGLPRVFLALSDAPALRGPRRRKCLSNAPTFSIFRRCLGAAPLLGRVGERALARDRRAPPATIVRGVRLRIGQKCASRPARGNAERETAG